MQGPVLDINTEAKTAIKNKLKRNKLDPIVISLPSASMITKDPLQQQSMKQSRPSNLGLNLTPSGLMAVSRASGLMLSPSLLSQSPSNLPFSPGIDLSELLARASSDHTPVDVFGEPESSCNESPANILRQAAPAILRNTSPASLMQDIFEPPKSELLSHLIGRNFATRILRSIPNSSCQAAAHPEKKGN